MSVFTKIHTLPIHNTVLVCRKELCLHECVVCMQMSISLVCRSVVMPLSSSTQHMHKTHTKKEISEGEKAIKKKNHFVFVSIMCNSNQHTPLKTDKNKSTRNALTLPPELHPQTCVYFRLLFSFQDRHLFWESFLEQDGFYFSNLFSLCLQIQDWTIEFMHLWSCPLAWSSHL